MHWLPSRLIAHGAAPSATLALPGLLVDRLSPAPATAGDSAEGELIEASRRGDENAFAALVRLHERRVFRLASRFFDAAQVEDVAQETFLTAWQKLDSYAAKAPFEHWLTRICLNLCYARLRRKRVDGDSASELPDAVIDRRRSGEESDARIEAERLLAHLAPADRFLLQLLHGEGWGVAEIAERTGWSKANVKVRAHRARRRLRKLLEADDAAPSRGGAS